jgi:HEAT repeat protein
MSATSLPALLADLRGRFAIPRKKAADALVQMGTSAIPGLIETLSHKNPDAQEAAADALVRIGTPEALAAVEGWKNR